MAEANSVIIANEVSKSVIRNQEIVLLLSKMRPHLYITVICIHNIGACFCKICLFLLLNFWVYLISELLSIP